MSDRAIRDVLASVLGEIYSYVIFWTLISNMNSSTHFLLNSKSEQKNKLD